MHDTKAEVSPAANKAATTLCGTLPKPRCAQAHQPSRLQNGPTQSRRWYRQGPLFHHTTFIAEVNAPTLAVMVTRLSRALKGRSTRTQRMTCTVIGNLVKLVRHPAGADDPFGPTEGPSSGDIPSEEEIMVAFKNFKPDA